MQLSRSFEKRRSDRRHVRSLAQISRQRDYDRLREQWNAGEPWAWRSTRRRSSDDDVTRLKSTSMTRLLSLDAPVSGVGHLETYKLPEEVDRYETPQEVERILRSCEDARFERKRSDVTRVNHLQSASMSCVDAGRVKSRKRENYVRDCLVSESCYLCVKCSVIVQARRRSYRSYCGY